MKSPARQLSLYIAYILGLVCGIFPAAESPVSISGLSSASSDVDYLELFHRWVKKYGKKYTGFEYSQRFAIFSRNVDFLRAEEGAAGSFDVDLNQFADLSPEEFKRSFLGDYSPPTYNFSQLSQDTNLGVMDCTDPDGLPSSVDWVAKGKVTPVQDQGSCGSSWAFAVIGAIESAYAIKTGQTTRLSKQQIVDCSQANQGCTGGFLDKGFESMKNAKQIATEASYPYIARDGQCRWGSYSPVNNIKGYTRVTTYDEDALMAAVARQPVAVTVAVSSGWRFYTKGVYDGACATARNHAALIVGYGTDTASGKKYWLVKETWGTSWGESGYIRVKRTGGKTAGFCGIALDAIYPTL